MFNDSEILGLFRLNESVSRETIAKSLNAYDISSKTELSKHLNRMRDDGLIVKVPDSRDWKLNPDGSPKVNASPASFSNRAPKSGATKTYKRTPDMSTLAPDISKKGKKVSEPTKKQREAVNKLDESKLAGSLNDALLRVQHKLSKGEVVNFDDKIYALNFLGKILDPTIDDLFQSIIGDLKQLQN